MVAMPIRATELLPHTEPLVAATVSRQLFSFWRAEQRLQVSTVSSVQTVLGCPLCCPLVEPSLVVVTSDYNVQ